MASSSSFSTRLSSLDVADLLAVDLFAHRGQHFAGGGGAEVGGDEGGFKIVERAGRRFPCRS